MNRRAFLGRALAASFVPLVAWAQQDPQRYIVGGSGPQLYKPECRITIDGRSDREAIMRHLTECLADQNARERFRP